MTPPIFLRIMNGRLILWDYYHHNQYEIDIRHLQRIIEMSDGAQITDSSIDQEITNTGIFVNPETDDWGWDWLSRIFHVGTQIPPEHRVSDSDDNSYRGYVQYCSRIADKIPSMFQAPDGIKVPLPHPDLDSIGCMSLKAALLNRKTTRSFHGEPLDLAIVSNSLYATFGAVHGEERSDLKALGLMPVGYRRTSPSGGSLQASEPYLVAIRVEGLAPGVYHYSSDKHQLTSIGGALAPGQLGRLLCAQNFSEDLAYGVFIVSLFSKMWWKYPHSRAYRVSLLDIGCLTQTFQLVCTAQGIQSWPTGYFLDHEVNRLLHLDDTQSSTMFFLGAGIGNGPVAAESIAAVREMIAGL